jgi:glutamate-1-semialdehyde aminotransferase
MNSGTRLWEETAKDIIPGGSQLLSKRAEMFLPEQWPSYYERADGTTIIDIDGNQYTDMSMMGIGACVLGYSSDRVDKQIKEAIDKAPMTTLNCPEEVELSKKLVKMHPWADMARLARTGGEAMTIAIRLARAATDRDTIAFCGYHGWHDWYLAANLETDDNLDGHLLPGLNPKGVPDALEGTAKPFKYGDVETLQEIVDNNEVGAIVMEPVRNVDADMDFLKGVRGVADETNAPLVFDEITSGFRTNVGGAHESLGIEPDVAVYGKALGNGYPIAAIVGRDHVMDMAQESFVSSTFWTERIGPTAGLATLEVMEQNDVPQHLCSLGKKLQTGLKEVATKNNIEIEINGLEPLTHFSFPYDQGQAMRTLFTQEMLDRDYIADHNIYLSYSHTEEKINSYLDTVDEVFSIVETARNDGTVKDQLRGPVAHSKFERLN